MKLTGETAVLGNMSQCHLVHLRSDMVSNPGLRGERPATNRLSDGTANKENRPELHIKTQSVPRSKHTPSQLYNPVS